MKLIRINVLFISLLFISCNNLKSKNEKTIANQMNDNQNIEKPIYSLKVISGNPYETYVNNLILEKDYDEGTTDHEVLINEYILFSGNQKIKAKILPNKDEEYLDDLSIQYFKIQIFLYEKGLIDYEKNNKKMIQEFHMTSRIEKMPFLNFEWSFLANVPYKNLGWSNSIKLDDEDQEKLMEEVISFYEKQRTALNEGNYDKYLGSLKKRDNEVFTSIYANEKIMKEDEEYMTNRILKSKNNMELLKDYQMVFYANGKVVALELKDGKSPLFASDENTFYRYRILLHRPSPEAPLEVIR